MKRLRTLFVISDLAGGGAEHQLSILLRHLSRERFEPHLCLWRPIFCRAPPADIPVHLVEKSRPWHLSRAIRGTRCLIEELRPDLIYSQLHYVNMVTGSALSRSRHQTAWICRQTSDPRCEMRGPFALWARRSLRNADYVIAGSKGVAQSTVEHLGLSPERVLQLDNVADIESIDSLSRQPLPFPPPSGTFTVVHAGRLERPKNQALLLRAFSRFRDQPAELWILGEGRLRIALQALARELQIDQQVRWLGFQLNPYRFLRAADCVALSSDREGMPNVLIEAAVCGTPAVATRCAFGPEELIEDGVTGLLTPARQCQPMADALDWMRSHPEGRRRMGIEAARRARVRFATERTCSAYEELFERVASGSQAPPVVPETNTRGCDVASTASD